MSGPSYDQPQYFFNILGRYPEAHNEKKLSLRIRHLRLKDIPPSALFLKKDQL